MSGKYRIIEKKGFIEKKEIIKIEETCSSHPLGEKCYLDVCKDKYQNINVETYIPRFIVQERDYIPLDFQLYIYKDIKEFTSLEEARKFKRDLELEDGVVIE